MFAGAATVSTGLDEVYPTFGSSCIPRQRVAPHVGPALRIVEVFSSARPSLRCLLTCPVPSPQTRRYLKINIFAVVSMTIAMFAAPLGPNPPTGLMYVCSRGHSLTGLHRDRAMHAARTSCQKGLFIGVFPPERCSALALHMPLSAGRHVRELRRR
jgi:hypothetical protein